MAELLGFQVLFEKKMTTFALANSRRATLK